jgi:hypothetical protein
MSAFFFQSLIDVDLWNDAEWLGTAFLHDPAGNDAPGIGLVFENIEAGRRIFSGWQERVGKVDEYDELRVSIIRGEILGEPSGYSVHISSNPFHSAQRAQDNGLTLDLEKAVIVSRCKRMTPDPGSPHLGRFEKEFARHKRYFILPVSSKATPDFGLSIEKREIHLRLASEIRGDDLDAVVFPEGYFDNDGRVQ